MALLPPPSAVGWDQASHSWAFQERPKSKMEQESPSWLQRLLSEGPLSPGCPLTDEDIEAGEGTWLVCGYRSVSRTEPRAGGRLRVSGLTTEPCPIGQDQMQVRAVKAFPRFSRVSKMPTLPGGVFAF